MMENRRKIISLFMLCIFMILAGTGIISYFTEYTRGIATVHTIFGILFTVAALVHMYNNLKPLKHYSKGRALLLVIILVTLLAYSFFQEVSPTKKFMDYGARSKVLLGKKENDNSYSMITMDMNKNTQLSLDIKRAQHFWHPQLAIWTEDTTGNYKETLFVTKATAKGIFAGGRSKENFKTLDNETITITDDVYRRVDALPVWSHKRGVKYPDGLFTPTFEDPLPDAISGATPLDNFIVKTSVDYQEPFVLKFEINVAFDDNEFYSEYDFPDDTTFHNGTGQLGQPSLIYTSTLDPKRNVNYQIMELQGHGHHSGKNGLIYTDMNQITTALEIIEFIVLGFNNKNQ